MPPLKMSLDEIASTMPPLKWVVEMHEHYAKTGVYRPEDLERVFGDPTKGVSMDTEEAVRLLVADARPW